MPLMCLLCENKKNMLSEAKTQTSLDCRGCYILNKIPAYFVNLTTLDISNCVNIISLPSSLVNLRILNCSYSSIRRISPKLRSLQTIDCSYCKELLELPETLTQLETLIANDSALTDIPDTFVELINLECDLTVITEIPSTLIKLENLSCSNCDYLESIDCSLPSVTSIDASLCEYLEYISGDFPMLTELKVDRCSSISYISGTFSNLDYLLATSCEDLVRIPSAPLLTHLDISRCTKLQELPDDMPLLSTLHMQISNMKCIPNTWTNLEFIDCGFCKSIKEIPNTILHLRYVCCNGSSIERIPPSDQNIIIDCSECPRLVDVPTNSTITAFGTPWIDHSENTQFKHNLSIISRIQKKFLRSRSKKIREHLSMIGVLNDIIMSYHR